MEPSGFYTIFTGIITIDGLRRILNNEQAITISQFHIQSISQATPA